MASMNREATEDQQPLENGNQVPQEPSVTNTQNHSSTPIELSEMPQSLAVADSTAAINTTSSDQTAVPQNSGQAKSQDSPRDSQRPLEPISSQNLSSQSNLTSSTTPVQPGESANPTAPPLTREATRPAIGPATDKPSLPAKETEVEGPVLYITLLLTTGARHPFRLDQKYLKKRNVEVEGKNPINMSLYKLKELILRDWREEWEAKPSSPESIRLISMGKLLTDKSKLSELGFRDAAAPTIVHMTIKPQEIVDEEEANKHVRERDGNERSPKCRCTIM